MKRIILYIIAIAIIAAILGYGNNQLNTISTEYQVAPLSMESFDTYLQERKRDFNEALSELNNCIEVVVNFEGNTCEADFKGSFAHCDAGFDNRFLDSPICSTYKVTRLATPESTKTIYMSSYVAGNKRFRDRLLSLIERTELNSVMIDIKEVDGIVTSREFTGIDPKMEIENRIPDLQQLLESLSDKNIYTIARIVVFKDAHMTEEYPEWAIKQLDQETIWKDHGGKTTIDPGAEEYWDYILALADRAYALGFDEINLDYIRFPSDGDMETTWYPFSQETIDNDPRNGKSHILTEFHEYFHDALRTKYPEIVTSADVFGMVTTNKDDLGIGQLLEPFLQHYDYVAPMVYPSHYPSYFMDLPSHPDNHPYEVVHYSMKTAAERAAAMGPEFTDKLRPWLQDFSCTWCTDYLRYGPEQLRAQINATYDAGLDSWMLWDAANTYTESGLLPK